MNPRNQIVIVIVSWVSQWGVGGEGKLDICSSPAFVVEIKIEERKKERNMQGNNNIFKLFIYYSSILNTPGSSENVLL